MDSLNDWCSTILNGLYFRKLYWLQSLKHLLRYHQVRKRDDSTAGESMGIAWLLSSINSDNIMCFLVDILQYGYLPILPSPSPGPSTQVENPEGITVPLRFPDSTLLAYPGYVWTGDRGCSPSALVSFLTIERQVQPTLFELFSLPYFLSYSKGVSQFPSKHAIYHLVPHQASPHHWSSHDRVIFVCCFYNSHVKGWHWSSSQARWLLLLWYTGWSRQLRDSLNVICGPLLAQSRHADIQQHWALVAQSVDLQSLVSYARD